MSYKIAQEWYNDSVCISHNPLDIFESLEEYEEMKVKSNVAVDKLVTFKEKIYRVNGNVIEVYGEEPDHKKSYGPLKGNEVGSILIGDGIAYIEHFISSKTIEYPGGRICQENHFKYELFSLKENKSLYYDDLFTSIHYLKNIKLRENGDVILFEINKYDQETAIRFSKNEQ